MKDFTIDRSKIFDNTAFWKQNSEDDYVKMIQGIISSDPFLGNKFYIFSFIKRVDDVTGVKKMYHQPRLTKPDPLPGTTLLRVDPRYPEECTIIWTLPDEESFSLYQLGRMFENEFVFDCVQKFLKDPQSMLQPEEGDLNDHEIREVYRTIRRTRKASFKDCLQDCS